jgi:hypothetical protein
VEFKLPFFTKLVYNNRVPPDCVSCDPVSKTKLLMIIAPEDKVGWVKIHPVFAGMMVLAVLPGKVAAGTKLVPL